MNRLKVAGLLRRTGAVLASTGKYLLAAWVFGLIHYNGPFPGESGFNGLLAIVWFAALLAVSFRIRNPQRKWLLVLGLFLLALIPYFSIRPSHERDWEEPFKYTARAEITGNTVTIHHFRSFDYSAEGEPIADWASRSYDLNKLQGMDFFMSHWGSELMGHPIFSFDFGSQGHLAFTIEARREKGEAYSLFAGLYRRYELSYIPCEEADAVRVRTNFRENENVHLYRTIATPEQARARFLEFIETMNTIQRQPRFYNVISSNCTTAVRSQMTGGFPFDWRIIANGKLDEMLYDRGLLVTKDLSFPELKRRALINPKVREHPEKKGFSNRIRQDVPGFE